MICTKSVYYLRKCGGVNYFNEKEFNGTEDTRVQRASDLLKPARFYFMQSDKKMRNFCFKLDFE